MEKLIKWQELLQFRILVIVFVLARRVLQINKFVNPFCKCFPRGFGVPVSKRWILWRTPEKKAK